MFDRLPRSVVLRGNEGDVRSDIQLAAPVGEEAPVNGRARGDAVVVEPAVEEARVKGHANRGAVVVVD